MHAREKLATLLWGDRYEDKARHSLRQAVLTLRKVLADTDSTILVSERDGLRIEPEAVSVDAREFERLAAGDGIESLSRAAALYTGELFDGLNVRSEGFDDWVQGERARFLESAAGALRSAASPRTRPRRAKSGPPSRRSNASSPSTPSGKRLTAR